MQERSVEIVRRGFILNEYDLTDLHIIDWSRGRAYRHPGEAIRIISSWLIGRAAYTIVKCDLREAPERSDWPGWKHAGWHEGLGRLFWNDFHWTQTGTLHFSDEPDFRGTLDLTEDSGGIVNFWGDIGTVSAVTFCHVQKRMREHDLWISVVDETHQVFIEALDDIQARYGDYFRRHGLIESMTSL